ncbi:MAG: TIGR03087 family PEP-CTERM/XrtA system glycosyltransferase [Pseudomonadota bacterium]
MTSPETRAAILYLAHRIPYPPNKGDKIRSWRTLEHLARRFRVHLAAFVDDRGDFQHRDHLESVCESVALVPLNRRVATLRSAAGLLTGAPLTRAYYRDARMAAAVAEARKNGLVAEIAFSSSMAQYLREKAGAPRIVDLCDADSAKWSEYARRKSWPMSAVYEREGRLLAEEETRIINWAEAAFAVSEEEADLLGNRDGVEKEVQWFCNGVDAEYFKPSAADGARSTAVFVGAMDYWANIDAVLWFAREIWPAVRASAPGATFAIVGSNPAKEIRALGGSDGVIVTGRVEDVRPYVAGADLVVAPMRIARGVQNKVLEAMAMGKAVIATPAALEGIDAQTGVEAIAAASPDSFAREVLKLAEDRSAAMRIGAAARTRILADYRWPAQLARLDAVLDRLIAR